MSGSKRLLLQLGLIAIVTALAAWGIRWQVNRIETAHTRQVWQQVTAVASDLRAQRLATLQLHADSLAKDPAFVDYVVQSMQPGAGVAGSIDRASISDLLSERRKGYDVAMVLDTRGMPVAQDGRLFTPEKSVANDSLVTRALDSAKPTRGVWLRDGKLAWVTVNPLVRSGVVSGLLLCAQQVGQPYVDAIHRYTGAEVALALASAKAGSGLSIAASRGLPPWSLPPLRDGAKKLLSGAPVPREGTLMRWRADGHTADGWAIPMADGNEQALLVVADTGTNASIGHDAAPLLYGLVVLALLAMGLALSGRSRRHVQEPTA